MIDPLLWVSFVAASLVIALIPGPGVTTIVGYALSGGRRIAFAAVAGAVVGNFVASTLSLAGVGLVLAQSALAFTVLKWVGAVYLIGLGLYSIWKARGRLDPAAPPAPPISARTAFAGTWMVTMLHPKTILFFVAFAPQFMSLDYEYWAQAAVLVVSFCAVLALSDSLYATAATAAFALVRGPKVQLWTKRAGGGVLVAAGVATAAARD